VSIQDEIFEEFVEKLRKDKDFPEHITDELENLFKNKENISQTKINQLVERGLEIEHKN